MGVALSTILLISSGETSSNRVIFFTDDAAKKFFPTSKISAQEIRHHIPGTSGECGKTESFLSEELSLSPDKTDNTVSIPSITVKIPARVIGQSSWVVYKYLERARCCQKPWPWRVRFWFVVRHFENGKREDKPKSSAHEQRFFRRAYPYRKQKETHE